MKRDKEGMHKIVILLLLLFFCPLSTPAQENLFAALSGTDTLRISLHESILTALENNPVFALQRFEPEIVAAAVEIERAQFDPNLNASVSRVESKSQRFLGTRPEPVELSGVRSQYEIGLSTMLPTGTTLSADISMSSSLSSLYTDQYSGYLGVTVAQSLLQGAGLGANLARLRQADLDAQLSREELKATAQNLVADVEKAYWALYMAAQEIRIQQQSLDLAERQLDESRERVAVGKLPELELAAVHAEAALRREALIDARSRYEQARLAFLFLLNPDTPTIWQTVPQLTDPPFIPVDTLASADVHQELGLTYRADLKRAQVQLKKGELEVQRTRNGLLPRLDFFITAGRSTYAKTFREGIPDYQSPFSDVSAGLSFSFPVINRQARAEASRARWTRDQFEHALENMQRLVQWDVRSAHIEALRSREQIRATAVTRELQEQKLAAEQEKFRVGKSTNFLVLQAQRDLTASLLDEARAKVAYLNALIDLYHTEGTLLERRGIEN
ncbi:TolC family protein [candidate division KSB1 bacterium]|nr:TolC family protein [candidate division KSB1 bacterium]